MAPFELATVLSALANASRAIGQIQGKLERLAKVEERMTIAERMTLAVDAMGVADAARSAMSLQDEMPRASTLLPPTASDVEDLDKIREFAILQSQRYAYAEKDLAAVYLDLPNFLTMQAMAAASIVEQFANEKHDQVAYIMQALGTQYLNLGDNATPAKAEFQRLRDPMTTFQTQFRLTEMGEISSMRRDPTAAVQHFQMPLNSALHSIARFSVAGRYGSGAIARIVNKIGSGAMEKLGPTMPRAKYGALDLSGLDGVVAWIRARPTLRMSGELADAFGIRGTGAELLSAQLGKVGEVQRALETSTGIPARAEKTAVKSTGSERLRTIGWSLSSQLLSTITRRIPDLPSAAQSAPHFVSRNEIIGNVLAYTAVLPDELLKQIDPGNDVAGMISDAIARFGVNHSSIPRPPLRHLRLPRQIAMTQTSVLVVEPAVELARTIARRLGRTPGGAAGVTIHYAPTINVSGSALPGEEWLKTARKHADELTRIITDKLNRQARLSFV